MTEDGKQKPPMLEGEAALDLWSLGPKAWNSRIKKQKFTDISFAGVDFSDKQNSEGDLSFMGYDFGESNVDFSETIFGDSNVSFAFTTFGKGDVSFSKATFGNGTISFDGSNFGDGKVDFSASNFGNGDVRFLETRFGKGEVNFSEAVFGDGQVNFIKANFGNGYVSFKNANFGKGDATFEEATFGDGNVHFFNATFGDGKVSFENATFGIGTVYFSDSKFGKGDVKFRETSFGSGDVSFSWVTFGDGDVDLSQAAFGDGSVDFIQTTFGDGDVKFLETTFGNGQVNFIETTFGKGDVNFFHSTVDDYLIFSKTILDNSRVIFDHASIKKLIFKPKSLGPKIISAQGLSIKILAIFHLRKSSDRLKSFDLFGASFDGPLILSGNLGIVPDLRAARFSHPVELSELNVKLQRISRSRCWFKKFFAVAKSRTYHTRLRRLKEIAETNKDHQAALRFSADENRARRWRETSWFGSVLDIAFSGFSNYGQSILKPFLWLFGFFSGFMSIYKILATAKCIGWLASLGQAILLSISNSLPFLPQSRELRTDALKALYTGDPGFWVDALMIGQGVLSFVFLFLIGLGLRNRFRL